MVVGSDEPYVRSCNDRNRVENPGVYVEVGGDAEPATGHDSAGWRLVGKEQAIGTAAEQWAAWQPLPEAAVA